MPVDSDVLVADGKLMTDCSDGTTSDDGVCDIPVVSIPGVVWRLHSTARVDVTFLDPGDGVTLQAGALFVRDANGDPIELTDVELEMRRALAAEADLRARIETSAGGASSAVVEAEVARAQAAEQSIRADLVDALYAHVRSTTPHPAYDDMADLTLLYRAATI